MFDEGIDGLIASELFGRILPPIIGCVLALIVLIFNW